MIRSRYKYIGWLLPAAIMLVLLIAIPAAANPGLKVSGAILLTDTSPGATLTHKMTVSLGDGDPATEITVQFGGIGQSLDGAYYLLEASEDTSYSARQFITVDKESFHLEPGAPQDITATIHIPQDVGTGGRYALIKIKAGPIGEGQVATVAAVNVPIALTIKDTVLTHQGKITELTTSEAVSGQPLGINTTFQNTGNHHFKVKDEVTVSNSKGEVLGTVSTSLTPSIIPTMSRRLKAALIPQGELPPGVYSVKSMVMLEDGTVLDEASGSFEVKEVYVPPETVTPAPGAGVNWPLVGGFIGGVILIGVLFFLLLWLIRRRRAWY